MSTIQINEKNFEEEVVKASLPVLVDFYADWCGPCKMAEPLIEELAESYKDRVKIGKVNVDESSSVAGKFGVSSIPTVVMFVDGKEVARQVGFGGKESYEAMIKKVI